MIKTIHDEKGWKLAQVKGFRIDKEKITHVPMRQNGKKIVEGVPRPYNLAYEQCELWETIYPKDKIWLEERITLEAIMDAATSLGSIKSVKKATAARENGKKGGRPKSKSK